MAQEVIHYTAIPLTLKESHGIAETFSESSSTLEDAAQAFAVIETLLFDDALKPIVLESVIRLMRQGIEARVERFAPTLSELYDKLSREIEEREKDAARFAVEEAARNKAKEETEHAA